MGAAIYFRYEAGHFDSMPTAGIRIRDRRKAQGLSQADLGKLAGLDQSTISDIERGADFGADKLIAIADALGLAAEFIMRGERGMDRALAEVMGSWTIITPEDRRALASTAAAYALRAQRLPETTPRKRIGNSR